MRSAVDVHVRAHEHTIPEPHLRAIEDRRTGISIEAALELDIIPIIAAKGTCQVEAQF